MIWPGDIGRTPCATALVLQRGGRVRDMGVPGGSGERVRAAPERCRASCKGVIIEWLCLLYTSDAADDEYNV